MFSFWIYLSLLMNDHKRRTISWLFSPIERSLQINGVNRLEGLRVYAEGSCSTANAAKDHRQERTSVSVRCIAGLCGVHPLLPPSCCVALRSPLGLSPRSTKHHRKA